MKHVIRFGALLLVGLLFMGALAGCGGAEPEESSDAKTDVEAESDADPQAEAEAAMDSANGVIEEWNAANEAQEALLEEIGAAPVDTPEQIDAVIAMLDELDASVATTIGLLEDATAELEPILSMDVEDKYKTYVQMIIESNEIDIAVHEKIGEMSGLMRQLYQELAKAEPSEDVINSLSDQLDALDAELDTLYADSAAKLEAADAYYEEQGLE